jgi:hypothetical protein
MFPLKLTWPSRSFRLAPADYHRFHSPIDGTVGEVVDIPGQYYTVNPQAVNEPGFDVFTANKRAVLYMTHKQSGKEIAFVAIGAMLVGSIAWTKVGDILVSYGAGLMRSDMRRARRREPKFVVARSSATLPTAVVPSWPSSPRVLSSESGIVTFSIDCALIAVYRFDEDLTKNSDNTIETLVKVGYSLGFSPGSCAYPFRKTVSPGAYDITCICVAAPAAGSAVPVSAENEGHGHGSGIGGMASGLVDKVKSLV